MMIKNRTKFVLTVGIGFSLFSGLSHTAFEREDDTTLVITNPSAPARLGLGTFALIHDTEGFFVFETNGEKNRVPNRLVDKSLRGIPQNVLEEFLKNNGRLSVNRNSDGEYSLRVSGGLDGGAPTEETEETIVTIGDAVAAGVVIGVELYKIYRELKPTIEQQNEDIFQKLRLNFATCLLEHPLEGTLEVPSACIEPLKKFKMMEDTMKVRGATPFVENEHNAQQVKLDSSAYVQKNPILDFKACMRKNPLLEHADGTVEIPSACISQFNQLKKDTTQH